MNKDKFLKDFELANSPVEILEEVVSWKDKVKCRCVLCDDIFYISPINLKRGSIHNKCSYIQRGKKRKLTHDEFLIKLMENNEDIEVLGKYIDAKTPISVKCKKCGYMWSPIPNNLLGGHGCKKCYYNKRSKQESYIKNLNHEVDEYCNEISKKYTSIIFLEEIKSLSSKTKCKCIKCNNIWNMTLNGLLKLKRDDFCPICSGKILDKEKFKHFLSNNKIKVACEPTKLSDTIECTCEECNYIWNIKCNLLLKHKGCPKCLGNIKITHEEFMDDINALDLDVELLSTYFNAKTKIKRLCKKCGNTGFLLPGKIRHGVCNNCANIKLHKLYAKSNEEFIDEVKIKYGNNYKAIDKYTNSHTKIRMIHNKCNNIFSFLPSSIYNVNQHICPYCYNKNSIGERLIENYLCENNITYKKQKTFNDLTGVNGGLLSYDFYIDNSNLLIEFQGIQHYKPVEYFGGEKQFKVQQEHDIRKYEYATRHNINIVLIPYWDYDNVDKILYDNVKPI